MDYKNGKIYAIRSHQTEQIYIGSTTQTLTKRLSKHKTQNCSSKLILQYADAYIELIENFPCNSKEELNKKEGEHIRTNNCVNKNMAGRTIEEYNEKFKKFQKKYREENQNKEKERNKNWYKNLTQEQLNKRKARQRELYALKKVIVQELR
jgi:hypothetical protein